MKSICYFVVLASFCGPLTGFAGELKVYTGENSVLSKIAWARLQKVLAEHPEVKLNPKLFRYSPKRSLVSANEGGGLLVRAPHLHKLVGKAAENLLILDQPLVETRIVVLSKTEFVLKGWESLAPYSNAIEQDIIVLKKMVPNPHLVKKLEQSFLMLDRGRVDNVVAFQDKARIVLAKLGLKGIKELNPPMKTVGGYFFIHNSFKSHVPKILKTMKKLKANGVYDSIKSEVLKSH